MKRWAIPVLSVVLAVAVTEEVLRTPAAAVDPGAGVALTSYGRNVWNLEALLRSTFGRRNLFIDYGVSRRRANFTTRRRASYRSGYYRYTFTDLLTRPSAFFGLLVRLDLRSAPRVEKCRSRSAAPTLRAPEACGCSCISAMAPRTGRSGAVRSRSVCNARRREGNP
jgi:hypothetical protein